MQSKLLDAFVYQMYTKFATKCIVLIVIFHRALWIIAHGYLLLLFWQQPSHLK